MENEQRTHKSRYNQDRLRYNLYIVQYIDIIYIFSNKMLTSKNILKKKSDTQATDKYEIYRTVPKS